jgi:hypothetical protein
MAAGIGFLTYVPDVASGGSNTSGLALLAQSFVCGGTGSQEITSIGVYVSDGANNYHVHLAIFTNDAANACPDTMVANSDSGELDAPANFTTQASFTYSTLPVLTGGATYWLVAIADNTGVSYSRIDPATAGGYMYGTAFTYPTFPTGDAWHTHSHGTRDMDTYAVYQAAAGAASIVPILMAQYRMRR